MRKVGSRLRPGSLPQMRSEPWAITLPMCAPVSDGAAAAILCTEQGLARLGVASRAVRLRTCVLGTSIYRAPDDLDRHIGRITALKAYEAASLAQRTFASRRFMTRPRLAKSSRWRTLVWLLAALEEKRRSQVKPHWVDVYRSILPAALRARAPNRCDRTCTDIRTRLPAPGRGRSAPGKRGKCGDCRERRRAMGRRRGCVRDQHPLR